MLDHHYLVPRHDEGIQKDLQHHIAAPTREDAEDMFVSAKDRLLDVNAWRVRSGLLSATFALADGHGKPLKRPAHKGDHIKIDIPGPGSATGDGYDWVQIEALEYDDYPDLDLETMAMQVRPCSNPAAKSDEHTAHFFGRLATSMFVIERRGVVLTAYYHGRNEVPNTDAGLIDEVRNMAVAAGAYLGLSDLQWGTLIKGLVEPE